MSEYETSERDGEGALYTLIEIYPGQEFHLVSWCGKDVCYGKKEGYENLLRHQAEFLPS